MGRALFSQSYSSPIVHTDPEPGLISCEKWSRCNPFDPDSDDFFNDAEYEAFVDPAIYRVVAPDRSGSPAFSEDSSSSERASSPITAVPDDQDAAMMGSGWEQRILASATEWRQNSDPSELLALFGPRAQRAAADDPAPHPPRNRTRSATVSSLSSSLPPSSLRNSTTATDIIIPSSFRRTVNITPIDIPILPDPAHPDTPSHSQLPTISLSPTTRVYMQNRLARTQTPPPPTSPLTNPRARMSFPRINVAPSVRVQNAVV